jgi:hypothetical protein
MVRLLEVLAAACRRGICGIRPLFLELELMFVKE